MGERKDGMTLERIDFNKGYFKENCKWIPKAEQPRNSRSNVWIEANGEKKILADWARLLGCKISTIKYRLESGWSPSLAVTVPMGTSANRKYNEYREKT